MTKKDLNNNMVIQLKNSYLFNYLEIENNDGEIERYFTRYGTKISLDTYNDDLSHKKYDSLRIIAIYNQKNLVNVNEENEDKLRNIIDNDLEVIWNNGVVLESE